MSKKKQSFLKSVKYSSTDGPTHRYNFDHRGKNVEIDIDNMPSGRQEVDFSYGGRMTRMGGDKTRGPELYKKIGKVIRAHDKLGRGGEHIIPHPYKKPGYDFSTIHEPSMNPKLGGRSSTRPRVTGRLLKRLSKRMGKEYSSAEGEPTAWGQRRTIHTVSEGWRDSLRKKVVKAQFRHGERKRKKRISKQEQQYARKILGLNELNLATVASAAAARKQRTIFNPTQHGIDQTAKNRIRLNKRKARTLADKELTDMLVRQGEQEGMAGEILKQRQAPPDKESKAFRFKEYKKRIKDGTHGKYDREIEARIRDSMMKQQTKPRRKK